MQVPTNETTLDALDQYGRGLRVVFRQRQDRFVQEVFEVDGHACRLMLTSCEGTDQEAWPPSPALQQLVLQPRIKDRQVALMVGMAGVNHWSLSIEADSSTCSLSFDVACRIKQHAGPLGSTYQCAFVRNASVPSKSRAELTINDHVHLKLLQQNEFPLQADYSDGTIRLRVDHGQANSSHTIQWKYQLTNGSINHQGRLGG